MAQALSIEVICTHILNLTLFLGLRSKNSFMLTPVTYIVINSISAVSGPYSDSYLSFQPVPDVYSNASPDTVSSGQFSELSQCSDCKPMRFHCRVSWYLSMDMIYMQVKFSSVSKGSCSWWMKCTRFLLGLCIVIYLLVIAGCCNPYTDSGEGKIWWFTIKSCVQATCCWHSPCLFHFRYVICLFLSNFKMLRLWRFKV